MRTSCYSLDEIVKAVIGKKCVNCGQKFELGNFEIGMYPHENGQYIVGLNKTLWVYIRCLNCDFQNALWKLGL